MITFVIIPKIFSFFLLPYFVPKCKYIVLLNTAFYNKEGAFYGHKQLTL